VAAVSPVVAQAPNARNPTASQQAATDRTLAASNETAADAAAARRRASTVAGADENAPVRRGPTLGNL